MTVKSKSSIKSKGLLNDKIRIRLKAYDVEVLDRAVEDIINALKRTGAKIAGPIPLPNKRERYTVNRSPHVDKKSREQFQMQTHKRLLDILEPNPNTVDALKTLYLPPGVDIKIKVA